MPEDKKDDDINIDFSSIKSFFKRKKEPEKALHDEKKPEVSAGTAHHHEEAAQKTGQEEASQKAGHRDHQAAPAESAVEEEFDWQKIKSGAKDLWSRRKQLFSQIEGAKDPGDADMQVDWRKLFTFAKKYQSLILVLIPFIFAIYLRTMAGGLPVADEWARSSVDNYIMNQVRSQVSQQYPNLPSQNRDIIVADEFEKARKSNPDQYQQQLRATADFFRSQLSMDNGQVYLNDIDTWFWMRHARNVVNNGHPGDEIKEGRSWDNKMLAPVGREIPPDRFHAYFIAYLYKIVKLFNKNFDIFAAAFYLPMIIAPLAVFPAFYIARRVSGNFGGLIAGLIVAVHPVIMSRTTVGFADTDAWNLTFPLYISWVFLEALESKERRYSIILAVVAGFLVGLYAFTWSGWWHIYYFLLLAGLGFLLYYLVIHRDELRANLVEAVKKPEIINVALVLGLFVLVSAISVITLTDYGTYIGGWTSPLGFTQFKSVGIWSSWPNVFTTVAEQNQTDIGGMIRQIGGRLLYVIALCGIMLSLWSRKNKRALEIGFFIAAALFYIVGIKYFSLDPKAFLFVLLFPIALKFIWAVHQKDSTIDVKYAALLILWLIATAYASTKGIRWVFLGVGPFSIAVGVALGNAYKSGVEFFSKGLHIKKIIASIVFIVVLLLLIGISPIPPFCKYGLCSSGRYIATHEAPFFNDAWYNPLIKIKAESAPDAIVNSWWDFGHWFKSVAERAVTFDGTTQNTPMAHFIGKMLLTDDEQLAVGTLRMVDCRSDFAVNFLEMKFNRTYKAVELLRRAMVVGREEAKKIYGEAGLSEKEVDEIIEMTHCSPPENYFITSDDMIGKSGVWAHFGIWDFRRATMYNFVYGASRQKGISFLMDEFNMSQKDAESMYAEIQGVDPNRDSNQWIAPWPSYSSGVDGCERQGNLLRCANNFKIDLEKNEAEVLTTEGVKYPKVLSIPSRSGVVVKEYKESYVSLNNGRPLGLVVIPGDKEGSSYSALFTDAELAGSMFTRLFYMDGHGLKCFEKFDDQRSAFGTRVIVWKVDWKCQQDRMAYDPKIVVPEAAGNQTS